MSIQGHHWTLYCSEMRKYIHFPAERCENYQLYQKVVQIKVIKKWISYEKVSVRMCPSPPGGELGGSKDCHLWNIIVCTEMGKWIYFRAQCYPNYRLYQKIVLIKVAENWNSYKKVTGRTSLSLPGVELRCSKDWYVSNIILYWNGKWIHFRVQRCQKYALYQNMLRIKVLEQ